MKNKCYRSSITTIPENQEILRNSSIPLFFSVEFENPAISAPIVSDKPIKCDNCKGYLNPYVEIIIPGYKWRCNLCANVNKVETPFIMSERKNNEFPNDPIKNSLFNHDCFLRDDLRNDIYEINLQESQAIQTPEPPLLCFILDVSTEAARLSAISSVLKTIKEILHSVKHDSLYDSRTKVAFMFYSKFTYLLKRNMTFNVISSSIPKFLLELFTFPLQEVQDLIDFDQLISYFYENSSGTSDFLLPFQVAIDSFRNASIFCFVSTLPNTARSKLHPTPSLCCTSVNYKVIAENLLCKSIAVNLFFLTCSNLEISTIGFLAQHTGGKLFHYANFDGNNPNSVTKLFCDLSYHFREEMGYWSICKIRASDGAILQKVFGNCKPKGQNILRYANWHSAHSINFSFMLLGNLKNALYVQIAMIRTNKQSSRQIRVFNICIPVRPTCLYDSCNSMAIAHALLLEGLEAEKHKKHAGGALIESSFKKILKEAKKNYGKIPPSFSDLFRLTLSAKKTIPLRPDSRTPFDFRAYYIYLFSNLYADIVDVMLYPTLINPDDPNLTKLPLSIKSIQPSDFYILCTGINLFFYFGKKCDKSKYTSLFSTFTTGSILFVPHMDDEYSQYISELVDVLIGTKSRKPNFTLVDASDQSIGADATEYHTAFQSYLYDDKIYDVMSLSEYCESLKKTFA